MRILIASNHRYPSDGPHGSGLHPKDFPSGSGGHMQDLLARGLAELGHDVFYLLRRGVDTPLPDKVQLVTDPIRNIDIYQTTTVPGANADVLTFVRQHELPSVLTCHLDRSKRGEGEPAGDNWIFVARALANTYGKDRYVLNGIDPAQCWFSAAKEDFVLFMAAAERAIEKGLETAISACKHAGVRLVVAGTGRSYGAIENVAALCRDGRAEYIGDIRGSDKAERLAAAKAVILPSRANEGCPLTLIEALMSGTPVIASAVGGIPEMITTDVGFLCADDHDYARALERLDEIAPERCRDYAIERFHYLRMARDYVAEFEREIAAQHRQPVHG
jgi:glycosyltransferase involved in cell wall biosynthesis